MIYQTINFSMFCDAFQAVRPDNFSYEGLEVLFNYVDEWSEGYELDVIELCCEFAEDTAESIRDQYNIEIQDGDDLLQKVVEHLEYNSIVVGVTSSNRIVYASF